MGEIKKLKAKLKDAESALVWYACHCPHSNKTKTTPVSNGGHATSLVADRYFDKHGYSEKDVKVIKR